MSLICGVDEAGRGPLAGPVVAAAVILDHDHEIIGLDDSKKISKPRREKLFYDIINNADIGIGITSHRIIDKINILEATYRSMRISIHTLKNKPSKALIDGFNIPEIDIKNEGIVGGDGKVESISAASIIAKVVRDKFMEMVDPIFPEYEFSKHKGYGTKKHIEILKKIGASEIHRKTFAPVKYNLKSLKKINNDKVSNNLDSVKIKKLNNDINNWFNVIGLMT